MFRNLAGRRRVFLLLLLGVGLFVHSFSSNAVRGQASPRLATVLQDLALAVPQDTGVVAEAVPGRAIQSNALPASVQDAMRARRLRLDTAGTVQVYLLMREVTEDTLNELRAAGAIIEIPDVINRRVQARVAVRRLEFIASLPDVAFVRLPTYAVHHIGSLTTEGDAIIHADQARQKFGIDGSGVKVGVISDGLKGIFAKGCTSCGAGTGSPITSGDLPDATGTRSASGVLTSSTGGILGKSFQANSDLEGLPSGSCAFAGAGAEGTALLEIVHDIAPGAQLSFANADTDMAFNQAVNYLATSNDIVMDDLGFYGEATDGTSTVSKNTAAALNNPAYQIRGYYTSNGNSADEHYFGAYSDSGIDGTTIGGIVNNGHLHQFQRSGDTTDVLGLGPQPYNVISLPTNGEAAIFLTWDDPFGGSKNNYDLYLVKASTGQVVAKSTDVQSGSQDPVEVIDYTNTGANDLFRIVVQNFHDSAQPKNLNLFSFAPECAADGPRLLVAGHHERHNYNTGSRSVAAQSDAGGSPVSVVSVGAICSASASASGVFAGSATPDESCNDKSNSTIEFFSSLGPTLDGRTKPDVASIDGVAVTAAGNFVKPFFGTSAATPHVAGMAALVLQSAPCLLSGNGGALGVNDARARLRGLVVNNTVHLGSVPNNTFGTGRTDAEASVERTIPSFGGASTLTIGGNTPSGADVTGAQLGFSDPNGCRISSLKWTGGCGAGPGTTLKCPFGTTNVSVSGSNNGVAFTSSHGVKVTVTNFGVATSPASATVSGGTAATYTVNVAPKGGPFPGPVTLSCSNLPAQATCTFNPAIVTPGSGGASSVLTLSTGTRASAPILLPTGKVLPTPKILPTPLWLLALLAPLAWRWRRTVGVGFAGALALLVALQACGGGSNNGSSNNGGGGGGGSTGSVTVSPASLTFATQALGTTSQAQGVTFSNTTTSAITISGVSITGDFAETNNCGGSLAASGSCNLNVTFTPTASGARAGTLTINDTGAGNPHTAALSGTGQSGPTPAGTYNIGVSGTSGSLVQSAAVTLTVQ